MTDAALDEVLAARRARWRVRAGAVVLLGLVALAGVVLAGALAPRGSTGTVAPAVTANPEEALGPPLYIHVLGAVPHPGLYVLREGDRVVDAIAAAGGFTDAADRGGVNLARVLADGEQLVVPVVGATTPAAGGTSATGLVDLNTADAAALDTLPRVGPAMAQRIIAFRESNGPITALEDLLGVTGIGEKTLEGLDGLVTW